MLANLNSSSMIRIRIVGNPILQLCRDSHVARLNRIRFLLWTFHRRVNGIAFARSSLRMTSQSCEATNRFQLRHSIQSTEMTPEGFPAPIDGSTSSN